MTTKRLCSWPGCNQVHDASRFMCREHWFRLPKAMRDAIWATYRAKPFNRANHLVNLRVAIEHARTIAQKGNANGRERETRGG